MGRLQVYLLWRLVRFLLLLLAWNTKGLWCPRWTWCQGVQNSFAPISSLPPESLGGGQSFAEGFACDTSAASFSAMVGSVTRVLASWKVLEGHSVVWSTFGWGQYAAFRRCRARIWRIGLTFPRLRLLQTLELGLSSFNNFSRNLRTKDGTFYALGACDNRIRQHESTSAEFIEYHFGVLYLELKGLSWALRIANSRPPSLWVLVFIPVLVDSTELTLPCLLFCWGHDVYFLPLGDIDIFLMYH